MKKNPMDFARAMGSRSAYKGLSLRANPYAGKAYRAAWIDGWKKARAALREERSP